MLCGPVGDTACHPAREPAPGLSACGLGAGPSEAGVGWRGGARAEDHGPVGHQHCPALSETLAIPLPVLFPWGP